MEDLIAPSANSVPIDVNINNFQKEVIEESTKTPVVVQFWASWCGPCKQLGPVLEKVVASEKGNVRLAKVDIDKNQQIAAQMRVQSVPTVYGFFNGQPVDGFAGVQPESSVKQFVKKLVSLMGNEPDINAILESATNLLESQDFDSAFAEFQEILSADPESIEGIAGMVRCLVGKRDLSAAREIVDQLDEEFLKS